MISDSAVFRNGGDIDAMNKLLAEGWDINQMINGYTPITLAIDGCVRGALDKSGVLPSIKWLTEHGANLNDRKGPVFPVACRSCNEETIRYLVANGADVNLERPVGGDAYMQAYYRLEADEKMDVFSLIQALIQ